MRVAIFLTILFSISGCTTLPEVDDVVADEYARCNVNKSEWRLLTVPPQNIMSLIESVGLNPESQNAFLFIDPHENVLYCITDGISYRSTFPLRVACGSALYEYKKTGNTWTPVKPSGDASSMMVCGSNLKTRM